GSDALSASAIDDVTRRIVVLFAGRDGLLMHSLPLRLCDGREKRIALYFNLHMRNVKNFPQPNGFLVDFTAPDDKDVSLSGRLLPNLNRLIQRPDDTRPGRIVISLACDNDVQPARQRPADTLPGLASHDDRLAHGDRLEALQVGGKSPRHIAVPTDHSVPRRRNNQCYSHDLFPVRRVRPRWARGWMDPPRSFRA